MLQLVQRARRRLFRNALLSQGANTASVALLVFILLLLLGTEILNWGWMVALPLAALGVGFFLAQRRLPSLYGTAQMIDSRMGLFDALSTALHFEKQQTAGANQEICGLQRARAEEVSKTVDLRLAIPYRFPRTAYLMAALFLVASSLFALRYGLTSRLDLKAPLARIIQDRMGFTERKELAKNTPQRRTPEAGQTDDGDSNAHAEEQRAADPDPDNTEEGQAASEKPTASGSKQDGKKQADGSKSEDGEPAGVEGENSKDDEDGNQAGNSGTPGNAKGDSSKEGNSKPESNTNANENSSLMSKLKDAMQNLLSKVKPQSQGGQQAASDQKGSQSKGSEGKKQQASKDGQQGAGQQSEGQEGEAGEQAQNQEGSEGKSSNKSDSAQTSKQPGSGMGSQDGDKSIKQAEQLAAMGKISEIIGKRSASLSGEATVEVQSTKQSLHTPYAQRGAQHSQGGAEINRDEIPVALQSYVQQYFEQVRKQAPVAKPAKK